MFFNEIYNDIGQLLTANVLFICFGIILVLFCPQKPNAFWGYRTGKAMSSIENWRKANKYASHSFLVCSIISLGMTLFLYGFIKVMECDFTYVKIFDSILLLLVPFLSIIYTEIKMKER